MNKKNFVRRSISIPTDLDDLLKIKFKESNYSFINQLLVELLELGIIKQMGIEEDKIQNDKIVSMLELICKKLEIK